MEGQCKDNAPTMELYKSKITQNEPKICTDYTDLTDYNGLVGSKTCFLKELRIGYVKFLNIIGSIEGTFVWSDGY